MELNLAAVKTKLKTMDKTEIKWFIEIAETGLKGSWKNHKLAGDVRTTLKVLKDELKRRK
jgi:hypothetical protein